MSAPERSDEERLRGIERWVGGAGHLSVDDIAWLLERVRALEAELREDRETRQALVLDEEAAALRAERDRLLTRVGDMLAEHGCHKPGCACESARAALQGGER